MIENAKDIFNIIAGLVLPYLIYIHKNLMNLKDNMNTKIDRNELENELDDMEKFVHMIQAPEKVRQSKAAEDIVRIEKKLDKVIEMLSNRH